MHSPRLRLDVKQSSERERDRAQVFAKPRVVASNVLTREPPRRRGRRGMQEAGWLRGSFRFAGTRSRISAQAIEHPSPSHKPLLNSSASSAPPGFPIPLRSPHGLRSTEDGTGGVLVERASVRSLPDAMTHSARPWTLVFLALPLVACGGSTTSTPLPQPLEIDAGNEPDDPFDADTKADGAIPDPEDASLSDPADGASEVAEVECPGWIVPDETASCSQNSMNNQCSANCRSGTRYWQSQCQDGSCTCTLGMEAKCGCEMEPGTCKSCCPGMAR